LKLLKIDDDCMNCHGLMDLDSECESELGTSDGCFVDVAAGKKMQSMSIAQVYHLDPRTSYHLG
jgi:hypothetical protein